MTELKIPLQNIADTMRNLFSLQHSNKHFEMTVYEEVGNTEITYRSRTGCVGFKKEIQNPYRISFYFLSDVTNEKTEIFDIRGTYYCKQLWLALATNHETKDTVQIYVPKLRKAIRKLLSGFYNFHIYLSAECQKLRTSIYTAISTTDPKDLDQFLNQDLDLDYMCFYTEILCKRQDILFLFGDEEIRSVLTEK